MHKIQMHDLQLWVKGDDGYNHVGTPVMNAPYAVCKARKTAMEANENVHFSYLKIVPNG